MPHNARRVLICAQTYLTEEKIEYTRNLSRENRIVNRTLKDFSLNFPRKAHTGVVFIYRNVACSELISNAYITRAIRQINCDELMHVTSFGITKTMNMSILGRTLIVSCRMMPKDAESLSNGNRDICLMMLDIIAGFRSRYSDSLVPLQNRTELTFAITPLAS